MTQDKTQQNVEKQKTEGSDSEKDKKKSQNTPSVIAKMAKRVFRSSSPDMVKSFSQILFLVLFDVFILVVMFIMLGQLSSKAYELQDMKNKKLRMETGSDARLVQQAIERYTNKIQALEQAIPDDEGMLVFINAIDQLKEQGIISNFRFASEASVKDRLGYEVLPVTIELIGNEDELNAGLVALTSLPSILRSVTFELEYQPVQDNYRVRIGGVLYVSGFTENK